MSSEPSLKLEPGITMAQSRTQDPSPLSSHDNPLSSRVHRQVPPIKEEPGRMLRQSGTQAPAPPSVSPTEQSSTQASAPPSISPTGHVQVSPGTKDEPDKMLAQSSMQAPAPLSTKSPGHVHVLPTKVDPVKMLSQSLQAPAPLSTKSPGHVHVLPTKVDPVKKLSQLSVQVSPFAQTQVSPFPFKLDPGKMRLHLGTHLIPVGPDPGWPEESNL